MSRTITDIRNAAQLIEVMQAGARPKYLFFWGHRAARDGRVTASCFSQWWPAEFQVDGIEYASAEHYMMAEKAQLFGDDAIRAQILAARTPAEAKALGRKVAGFDDEHWERERFAIVVAANAAKFDQHVALREFLVQTGDRVLVEASPVDVVWGIGLPAGHEDAERPESWRGLNLLGFALMEVRERLTKNRITKEKEDEHPRADADQQVP
ncbi:NADAR family protein [Rhizobacter sp. Root1221]|uniref:NADAR family protein n=1 Tax=Rhizobacter sp. Root1221 TaxID=1736433 RepID=UPI0009EB914B|nr:NADAR family protein [Rhizobacter sp. Root1221]